MRLRGCWAVCLALAWLSAWGQVSKPGTGTVTGHVICQDMQRPARFAQVMIFSVPASTVTAGNVDAADPKSIKAFNQTMNEAMNSASFVLTETGYDGSFVVEDVAPGDYYVMASVAGYVQPRNLVQAAVDAGEDITKGIPGVPMVHVSADRSVSADVAVSRGAAIEGNVTWDDGAPVSAAIVNVEPKSGDHKPLPAQFTLVSMSGMSVGNTDDRGHYRISGLAPGEYIVRAMLQTNRRMSMQRGHFNPNANIGAMPLLVYAPGGFRKTDAKPLTLTTGEEHPDEDITFNLNATHTVSGRVTSAEDQHGLNRGVVTLIDSGDNTFRRSGGLDQDGTFTIMFVPSGTYTMSVSNAADTVAEPAKDPQPGALVTMDQVRAVRSYRKADRRLMVSDGDVTGQNIELQPEKVQPDAGDEGR